MMAVFLVNTADFGEDFIFKTPTSQCGKNANIDTPPNLVPVADASRAEMFIFGRPFR